MPPTAPLRNREAGGSLPLPHHAAHLLGGVLAAACTSPALSASRKPVQPRKFGFPALRGQPLAPARIAEQVHAREQLAARRARNLAAFSANIEGHQQRRRERLEAAFRKGLAEMRWRRRKGRQRLRQRHPAWFP